MGLVAPWHVGSSQTRARTCVPCISRQILNPCTTREAPSGEFLISFIVLFIIVCLLFSSSRSLFNVSCIFSILFPRFWIIFSIITLNNFSGRLPISSLFVWSHGFLLCSFVCCVFLCLSFCLPYCVWGLLSTGCRFIVPVVFGVFPQWVRLVQWVV